MTNMGVQEAVEEALPESRCVDKRSHYWGEEKDLPVWGKKEQELD